MATTKVSKVSAEDAQTWLSSLQQVGEGWYRNLALAIKANAHTALGMDRREFAAQVGQRLVDPRDAIIELHKDGMAIRAIKDILGVGEDTVRNVLIEDGRIEGRLSPKGALAGPQRAGLPSPDDPQRADTVDGEAEEVFDAEELQRQIDELGLALEGAKNARDREVKELKDRLKDAAKDAREKLRKARDEWEADQSDEDRKRLLKEAEAWAEEQGQRVLAGFARLGVQGVVGNLDDATKNLKLLIKEGGLTDTLVQRIEKAHANFNEELRVASATVGAAS